jgi:predicted dienelactone hydrolase
MIFLTFACSADKVDSASTIQQEAQVDPLEWDFWEDGPYRVGYIKWDFTFTNPAGNERTIPMNLWYPTNDDDGDDVYYFGSPDPLSFGDAEPMAPVYTGGFPVFVYSHGSYGYGGTSPFLSRHFASHGWLVIAPDHLGNTIADYGDDVSFGVRYNRPGDDWAAIDALDSIPDWSLPINTDAVILSGHSYGGYDNWAVAGASINMETVQSQCDGGGWAEECTSNDVAAFASGFKDERVKGIIPMAGAGNFNWFEEDAFHNISTPALVMSGTNDDDEPQYLWDNSDGTSMTWIEIEGACHQAFALGGCLELTNEDGFRLINGYSLAFSRQILLADSSTVTVDLLQGSTVPDGIQIHTRE